MTSFVEGDNILENEDNEVEGSLTELRPVVFHESDSDVVDDTGGLNLHRGLGATHDGRESDMFDVLGGFQLVRACFARNRFCEPHHIRAL